MQEPSKFCPRCSTRNYEGAAFCQSCGAQFSIPPSVTHAQRRPESLRFLLFLGAAFFGLMLVGWIYKALQPGDPPPSASAALTISPTPVSSPTPDLPPAELLARAKALLAQPYDKSGYEAAEYLLDRIQSDTKERKESMPLKQKVVKARAREEATAVAAVHRHLAERRKAFATEAEENLLSKGYDATVTVSGTENRTLRITYVLMSRPMVYQLTNEARFLELAEGKGFYKVIFSDGYDSAWRFTYNEKTRQWN